MVNVDYVMESIDEVECDDYVGSVLKQDSKEESTMLLVKAMQLGNLKQEGLLSFDSDADATLWNDLEKLGVIDKIKSLCSTTTEFEFGDDEEKISHCDGIAMRSCWDGAISSVYIPKTKLIELVKEAFEATE